jgi:hypothetical protein
MGRRLGLKVVVQYGYVEMGWKVLNERRQIKNPAEAGFCSHTVRLDDPTCLATPYLNVLCSKIVTLQINFIMHILFCQIQGGKNNEGLFRWAGHRDRICGLGSN